jgi:uncharacterized membrane protein YccC
MNNGDLAGGVPSALIRAWTSLKQPLKTGVAAALATVTCQLLHLRHGYWIMLSAIIVLQSNLGRSIRAGVNRLLGTAVGALVGTAVTWLAGTHLLATFLAVTLTMWICSITPLQEGQRLAGVTAMIVMLVRDEFGWRAGIARFADVSLGIVVALTVSIVWPSRARHDLRASLAVSFQDLDLLFALVIASLSGDSRTEAIEQAEDRVRENSHRNLELLRDTEREAGQGDGLLSALFHSSEHVRELTFGMGDSARGMLHDSFYHQLEQPLNALYSAARQTFAVVIADLRDQPRPPLPPLRERSEDLENRFANLLEARLAEPFSAAELIRFASLFSWSRQLTEELSRCMEWAHALDQSRIADN